MSGDGDEPSTGSSPSGSEDSGSQGSGSQGSELEHAPRVLTPARPDVTDTGASWAPRIPWLWIILGIGGIVAVFASYFIRQAQRQEALRAQMVELHEQRLTEPAERYMAFRERIERLVIEAHEQGEPETYVDPRLNISGLRAGEGIYLRIPADWAEDAEHVRAAAMQTAPDAITRCLGLAPMSVRGLYERGDFLTPEWIQGVRDEPSMMSLRVLDDQLGRHVQVDVPVVLSMTQASWFMLVLQQGESRSDEPVDVYLWDLRRDQQLLRARVQGRGLLVGVRMQFEGVQGQRAPGRTAATSGGAADCSIASQIRGLTGQRGVEFESSQQVLDAEPDEEEAEGAETGSANSANPDPEGADTGEADRADADELGPGAEPANEASADEPASEASADEAGAERAPEAP